jgi:hypothetical protein
MMNDAELGRHLAPDADETTQLEIVNALAPERRELCEKLIALADKLNRGDRPKGVIVCREKRKRKRS